MQLTALQAQNRSGLHFCTFIIVRPLTHTRSSKLLCNLLHCELRIALDCIFALLSSVRPLSHTRSSKLLCNLLHCELRIALDCIFALFIIFRPLSHTRSSKLLCNLLHCGLRIALDCIFALLSSPDHSHTPDLVNYYATYCIASSESLWIAFLHFYHCQTTLTHQI